MGQHPNEYPTQNKRSHSMHIPERRRSLRRGNAWTDASRQQRITVHSTSSTQPYHYCLFDTMSALPTIEIYSTGANVKGQTSAWERSGSSRLVRINISLYEQERKYHYLKLYMADCITAYTCALDLAWGFLFFLFIRNVTGDSCYCSQ